MIFVSCRACAYRMDVFQELPELADAPLACPRCGGLDFMLEPTTDPDDEAVSQSGSERLRAGVAVDAVRR